jgi:hypothetical protein
MLSEPGAGGLAGWLDFGVYLQAGAVGPRSSAAQTRRRLMVPLRAGVSGLSACPERRHEG